MKKLILILALVFTATLVKAQADLNVLPLQNGKVIFSRSSDALDVPKNTVFARGEAWMANYTAMGMAIRFAEGNTGLISGSGHFTLKLNGDGFSADSNRFDFKVQISCADNQYSLNIDTITFTTFGKDGSATSSHTPLETEKRTSKANANAINMQFENIYFSLIDAMSNAAITSKAALSYTLVPQSQLYVNLIKSTVTNNFIDYATPDEEIIQIQKTMSDDGFNTTTISFSILRPIAEATDRPLLLTFDDDSVDTLSSRSYWTKQGDQFLYKFVLDVHAGEMLLLAQKRLQKIQMAETTINITDLLDAKVKAWAGYLNTLTPADITAIAQPQPTTAALPEIDGKVTYQSIVDIPNKNKDFIFNAANKWVVDSFSGKTGGILNEDKDQGQILAKVGFKFTTKGNLLVAGSNYMYIFNVQIDCKDAKYRIRLYNMYYGSSVYDRNPIDLEFYNDTLKNARSAIVKENGYDLDAQFKATMQSLADAITKAAKDDF